MVNIAMQVVNPSLIAGKKVLLRLDIDVPIELGVRSSEFVVKEDFKLKTGLPTVKLCLENASQVIAMGHIGRPGGKVVPGLSIEPIRKWFIEQGFSNNKLKILENLRFDIREDKCDLGYAKELAGMGDFFVSEAFASYHPASSTTILPTLLPHAIGLRFAEEIEKLTEVKNNPKKPYVAVMGGIKVADKLPVIEVLAKSADVVLVGGKLVSEIREQNLELPKNTMVGMLNEDGFDIAPQTVEAWKGLIMKAKMIVWNGPLGRIQSSEFRVQNSESMGSEKGTYEVAKMVLESNAEIIVGGGDTIGFLGKMGLLDKFEQKGFISTGGGAMLKFLVAGTLPTIEALDKE
ncbi:phosphoglycerate kinase [Patescibacteria group bacterium]|nr:phosphoglycerate kinase [Patescibacteria group bacterium]